MPVLSKPSGLVLLLLVITQPGLATIEDIVIKQGVQVAPGKTWQLDIKSNEKVSWGLFVDKATPCEQACISIRPAGADAVYAVQTPTNAFSTYEPQQGLVSLLFTNIAKHPVSVSVHRYIYHCTASACDKLKTLGINRPLEFGKTGYKNKRIRIASIESIRDSKDGSWAEVKGKTQSGKDFTVTFVWWLYDAVQEISCGKGTFIHHYRSKLEQGREPVHIAGNLVTIKSRQLMKVDSCSSRAQPGPDTDWDI